MVSVMLQPLCFQYSLYMWLGVPQNRAGLCVEEKKNLPRLKSNPDPVCAQEKKLHGLSPQANYTERPPLVGEVIANFCG
jgi:hypothetical protein